jgi:hypothetical protein
MQIAAGYEHANDCNFLKDDGIIKLCSQSDKLMATQPTMCRMENQSKSTELYKMAKVFVDNLYRFLWSIISDRTKLVLEQRRKITALFSHTCANFLVVILPILMIIPVESLHLKIVSFFLLL